MQMLWNNTAKKSFIPISFLVRLFVNYCCFSLSHWVFDRFDVCRLRVWFSVFHLCCCYVPRLPCSFSFRVSYFLLPWSHASPAAMNKHINSGFKRKRLLQSEIFISFVNSSPLNGDIRLTSMCACRCARYVLSIPSVWRNCMNFYLFIGSSTKSDGDIAFEPYAIGNRMQACNFFVNDLQLFVLKMIAESTRWHTITVSTIEMSEYFLSEWLLSICIIICSHEKRIWPKRIPIAVGWTILIFIFIDLFAAISEEWPKMGKNLSIPKRCYGDLPIRRPTSTTKFWLNCSGPTPFRTDRKRWPGTQ